MPIQTYTVDEGILTVGSTAGGGTVLDMTAQVRNAAVDFSEEVGDSRKTLSGDTLTGQASYPATLSGTVIQDLSSAGLIDWTWAQRGKVHPFVFTPSSASEREITGMVRVAPLKVGGEAGEDGPESDFEWACIGDPVLGASL